MRKIRLQYFKPSGKFYAEGELEITDETDRQDVHMIVKLLMGQRALPGLVSGHDSYDVLIAECPPRLVLSERRC